MSLLRLLVRTAQRGERRDDEACMRLARPLPHSATPHWGGGGDGTPHLPLTWDALLLIDSARRGRSGPQSILVASPFYVLDR